MCSGAGGVLVTDDAGNRRMRPCACTEPPAMPPWLSRRFGRATLATLPAPLVAAAQVYPSRGMLVTGKAGRGKTWAAVAIAREQGRVGFIWWPDWLSRFRVVDLEAPREALDSLDALSRTPNLIIDDVGSESSTDYGRRILFLLLEHRDARGRTEIITSNLSLQAIGESYDTRIASRIAGRMTRVELAGPDRRRATAAPRIVVEA